MSRSVLWRGVLIVVLAGLALWAGFPPNEKLNLGLDLQGGIHLVLQVQTQDAVKAEAEKDIEVLTREADDEGIPALTTAKSDDTAFTVPSVPDDKRAAFEKVANDYLPGWDWSRVGGGYSFAMRPANEKAIRDGAVNQALQTIRNRLPHATAIGKDQPAARFFA